MRTTVPYHSPAAATAAGNPLFEHNQVDKVTQGCPVPVAMPPGSRGVNRGVVMGMWLLHVRPECIL